MKIVFIAIKGMDVIGGIETYTVELGRRLVSEGHEVIVYCMQTPEYSKAFEYQGMQVIPLKTLKHKYFEKMALVIAASFHQITLKKVDVVHYHAVGPSLFAFIPRLMGRYTVFQSHGHEWERSSWNSIARTFFKLAEKLTFSFVNDSTAVSKALSNYYQFKYSKPVTYIPSGINIIPEHEADNILEYGVKPNEYFLYVGRLSREKRIHDLIKAFNLLNNTNTKLVIVGKERKGDEDYRAELTNLSKNNDNIIFTGAAYGPALAEWYSNALAYILPSQMEGLPITLLEAMSFGRCCIASDIEANQEALAEKGLIYPVGNIARLAKHLEFAEHYPDLAAKQGKVLQQHAIKNYTWSFVANEFLKFYKKSQNTLGHNPIVLPK